MAVILKTTLGTQITPLNTGASLADGVGAASSAINNTVGGGGPDGYERCRFTLNGTFSVTPSANASMNIWFLTSGDGGSTYEDGSSSVFPTRNPDCVIPWRLVTTAQQIDQSCDFPGGFSKVLARNTGSGQTLGSGWTLKLLPITDGGY